MMATAPRHWLGVVSREHVLLGRERGIVQINHGKRNMLQRMAAGKAPDA